jgi:hypothetical protein
MRRFWLGAMLTTTLATSGAGVAVAEEEIAGWIAKEPPQRATIITGDDCIMPTDEAGTTRFRSDDMRAVITSSGQVSLVCHGQLPPADVEPFTASGFPCRLGSVDLITRQSHVTWNSTGQGTLTCQGTLPSAS